MEDESLYDVILSSLPAAERRKLMGGVPTVNVQIVNETTISNVVPSSSDQNTGASTSSTVRKERKPKRRSRLIDDVDRRRGATVGRGNIHPTRIKSETGEHQVGRRGTPFQRDSQLRVVEPLLSPQAQRSRANGRQPGVVIPIPNRDAVDVPFHSETELTIFMTMLYCSGVSPVNIRSKLRSMLQLAIFILFSLVATWEAFILIKWVYLLGKREKGDLSFHVKIGWFGVVLAYTCAYIAIVVFKHTDIADLFEILKKWQELPLIRQEGAPSLTAAVPMICLLTSVLLGIFASVVHAGQDYGWEMEEIILHKSREFAVSMFLWQREGVRAQFKALTVEYALDLTPKTLCCGLLQLLLSVIGNVYGNLVLDVGLVLAWSLLRMVWSLRRSLRNHTKKSGTLTPEVCQQIWEQRETLSEFSMALDKIFGTVFLPLQHLDHLTFAAHFGYFLFVGKLLLPVLILQVCLILKFVVFYILALMQSNVDAEFKDWVIDNFDGNDTLFMEGGVYLSKATVFEKMKTRPIGMGSGMVYINKEFILKFCSVTVSLFFFFANPRVNHTSSN